MINVYMRKDSTNLLGRLGENEHRRMIFDISYYLDMYPNADFVLLNTLPGASSGYPVANTTKDNHYLYWTTTSSDLSKVGNGCCELLIYQENVIAKSDIYRTKILESIDGSGDAPDPWQSWYDDFAEIRDETVAASQAIQNMGVDAITLQPDIPATVTKIVNPATGAVTLIFSIPKGEQGIQGEVGRNGVIYTPAVLDSGVITWSNDGGLPNPPSVDIAGALRDIIDASISGSNVTINAENNYRYLCGEVSSISIVPPQNGICDVIFRSGSSRAILSVPDSVKWPEWFDENSLETNTIYEINIVDGVYGAVMMWPV